uniref:Transposase (putative) gypsy type domain-containing protein n=1 Tax=Oryza sativa subsp. japonica TaxID=39947 RepID=Q6AUQ9_ORYSJ|nr:hypothetical protein [Oryza sativa Japonica Group]
MARGSAPLDGSVLPPSRIVSERQAGLPRRFMPESATGREVVALGEGRPAPHYPGRSVFFLSFAMAGLVPPFSIFFMDILEFYDLQMAHLTPNAIMTLAIFAHLCEMFIGVRPSLRLFRWFFTVQPVSPPTVVGGCYFQPRGQVLNRYIPCVLRKKWDDWKSDWFYTSLADEARLRLPSQPPAQASSWRAAVDLGDGYDAVLDRLAGLRSQGLTGAMVFGDYLRRRIAPLQRRARGAWEYTGPKDYMRTHQGRKWDWDPEDFRMVVQRVLNLSSVEASLIPQGVLPLCCDLERAKILAIMQVVGASGERAPRGHDGAGGSRRGEQSTPGGGRASGPRDRGPGGSPPADARGKRKQEGTPPPSPPRGGGAVRASSRRPEGAVPTPQPEGERKKKRLRKMGGPRHAGGTSSRPRGGRLADLPAGERPADREAAVATREATLAAHEAACAEEESALRLREDALTEWGRALEEAKAAAQRLADSLFLREAAREEQARRNLEGARAERAALDQRAAKLEARAKELDARAHSGGAAAGLGDLAARLAAAEHTIAELQGALDSSAGEVEALRMASEVGPGMLRDAVSRLDRAGRQAGLWGGRYAKYAANQGGLAQRLSEMAGALERLPEELEETIKSSSRDLARGAVELVLARYQARDPDFSPWAALEEFPPGTGDGARAQVRDAADHIVHSFEGTAPQLAFALDSDEEGGDDGADDSDDEAGDPGASE